MVLSKSRGVRFEYRVAHKFKKFGYTWDRSGSSLGVDLKILKNGELHYLVSCKKTSKSRVIYLPQKEVEELSVEASNRGAEGLICFGFYRTPIFVHPIEEIEDLEKTKKSYKLEEGGSGSLTAFLSEASQCESSTGISSTGG